MGLNYTCFIYPIELLLHATDLRDQNPTRLDAVHTSTKEKKNYTYIKNKTGMEKEDAWGDVVQS